MGCPSGCYRRFVILLAVPPHSSRQLLCPSASFIQPLLIRSIAPCSLPFCCFTAWHPAAKHIPNRQAAQSLLQAAARLTRLHSTASSLFHFSRFQSTRCQFLFCSPAAPLRLHSPCGCYCSFAPPCPTKPGDGGISQSIAKFHLHSSATFVPCGKYTSVASYVAAIAPDDRGFPGSPFVGARRPPPLRRTSLFRRPSNGSQSLQCGQVCRTAMLLFCRRRFYRKS